MSLLIRNARIVTSTDDYIADVYCEDEAIALIANEIESVEGAEVIDATGKFLFPGFIDPHVHVHLPFMGTHARDDWASISRAALVGGTTTLIEMCVPARGEDPIDAFELWNGKAEGLAACDYTFHMGVSSYDDDIEAKLRDIVGRGISSFKVFLAYKGAFGVTDQELYRTLRLARELGVIVTAHCENETIVDELQQELLAAGMTGPGYHEPSRPPQVEMEGVQHLMTFAELTGAHTYVVHTSCEQAVAAAEAARSRGVNVWIETVIPYLVLDKTYAERDGFEGAKYVMSPPIRGVEHQDVLWNGLRSRSISTVATDHAPFDFVGQKDMGKDDFTKIPNGVPSVQHRVELLWSHGVTTGRIDLNTFVDCASTQAARLFGLDRKGTIAVGADADLVIWDPERAGTISAATHESATDYSPFEGWSITGRAELVTVRGEVMVRDGAFCGPQDHGKRVLREPSH